MYAGDATVLARCAGALPPFCSPRGRSWGFGFDAFLIASGLGASAEIADDGAVVVAAEMLASAGERRGRQGQLT